MTDTLRDQVWNAALEQLVAKGKFTITCLLDELDLGDSKRQTVRRTLNAQEKAGWLERDSKQSSIWRLGWKGRLLLNVSEFTIEQSRR